MSNNRYISTEYPEESMNESMMNSNSNRMMNQQMRMDDSVMMSKPMNSTPMMGPSSSKEKLTLMPIPTMEEQNMLSMKQSSVPTLKEKNMPIMEIPTIGGNTNKVTFGLGNMKISERVTPLPGSVAATAAGAPNLKRIVQALIGAMLVDDGKPSTKTLEDQLNSSYGTSTQQMNRIKRLIAVKKALADPNTLITVFVPTDDVFDRIDKLPKNDPIKQKVNQIISDPELLQDLLLGHIHIGNKLMPNNLGSFSIIESQRRKVDEFGNEEMCIQKDPKTGITINQNIKVTGTVEGKNFAVHTIDDLIIPIKKVSSVCGINPKKF